ncbi:MAG: hypothetical protein ABSF24_09550 [Candidatus Bathyarchaeia archaeon]
MSGIQGNSSAPTGGICLDVAWRLRLMKWMPAILAVAIAMCVWHWGGGRLDV